VARQKPKSSGLGGGGILLPPPPGSSKAAAAAAAYSANPTPANTYQSNMAAINVNNATAAAATSKNTQLLLDFDSPIQK
jgi:hypothetical protein